MYVKSLRDSIGSRDLIHYPIVHDGVEVGPVYFTSLVVVLTPLGECQLGAPTGNPPETSQEDRDKRQT